jgi:hypothetical protein
VLGHILALTNSQLHLTLLKVMLQLMGYASAGFRGLQSCKSAGSVPLLVPVQCVHRAQTWMPNPDWLQWAKEYGPIYRIRVGQPVYVISEWLLVEVRDCFQIIAYLGVTGLWWLLTLAAIPLYFGSSWWQLKPVSRVCYSY